MLICVGCARVSDTNKLVSPMQSSHIGGLDQREFEAPSREFRVALEYRLMCFSLGCIKLAIQPNANEMNK